MQIVRTIIWVLLLVALGIFSWANWDPRITVYIWEGMVLDTRLPAIVIIAWAIGFVPLWLVHRTAKWQFRRRISMLETAMRNAATPPPPQTDNAAAAEVADPFDATDLSHPAPVESKPILP